MSVNVPPRSTENLKWRPEGGGGWVMTKRKGEGWDLQMLFAIVALHLEGRIWSAQLAKC